MTKVNLLVHFFSPVLFASSYFLFISQIVYSRHLPLSLYFPSPYNSPLFLSFPPKTILICTLCLFKLSLFQPKSHLSLTLSLFFFTFSCVCITMTVSQNYSPCDQAKFHPLCLQIADKHTGQTLTQKTAGIYVSSLDPNSNYLVFPVNLGSIISYK